VRQQFEQLVENVDAEYECDVDAGADYEYEFECGVHPDG
jgi:hypothetical protein